jgi:hypothetical protein
MNREIQEVEQEKTCKYPMTAIRESTQYQQMKEIKKNVYDRRQRMILKSELNANNTITATAAVGAAAVPTLRHNFIHSFIPLPCAEGGNSLLFSGASSIPLCFILFPATLLHQLLLHPPSLHLAIYFLVYQIG